jgi:hypothetical protein
MPCSEKAFRDVFGRLVRQTKTAPGTIDRFTAGAYYELLGELPLEALRDAAERWARTNVFFPSVAEWRLAATSLDREPTDLCDCTVCDDRGLIVVRYVTNESFDLAICNCRRGNWFRAAGERFIRARLQLDATHRIADVDAFAGDDGDCPDLAALRQRPEGT